MQTRILTSVGQLAAQYGMPVQAVREVLARRRVRPELILNSIEHYPVAAFAALAAEKAPSARKATTTMATKFTDAEIIETLRGSHPDVREKQAQAIASDEWDGSLIDRSRFSTRERYITVRAAELVGKFQRA